MKISSTEKSENIKNTFAHCNTAGTQCNDVQRQRRIILYVRASLTPLWVTVASTMKTWSIISSCSRNAISSTSTLTGRKLQIQSVKDRTSNPKSIMRTIFFRVFRRRPVNAGESVQLGLLKENIQNGKHLFPGKCSLKLALNDDKNM